VRLRTAVRAVRSTGGRVRGVEIADGEALDAPVVINAAGPWCNALTRSAGLDLPWTLRPTRVQVLFREWPREVPGPIPVTADGPNGIYFRPESRGQQILLGSIRAEDEQERVEDPDRFDRSADAEFREAKLVGLHHRIPGLPHRGRVTGLAGLYAVCEEDVHPIVGPTPLEGYAVANGFSGHGFKLAPMVGAMLARWLTGKGASFDTDVPLDFLAVDRQPLSVRTHSVLA
jgi:glycine/D-amino acid oxidase-like deaminating enzyme